MLKAIMVMGRIYVGSIPFDHGEESLRQTFSPFGPIRSVSLSFDNQSAHHKVPHCLQALHPRSFYDSQWQGFAFVEFETAEAATLALEQMQVGTIGGRPIKVLSSIIFIFFFFLRCFGMYQF